MEQKIRSSKQCNKCKSSFSFTSNDVFWDDHGTGYSTKLCKCTKCGCVNVVEYSLDYGMDVNRDKRFYKY